MKLISGEKNVPYIVCKLGYALGVTKPKRAVIAKPQPIHTVLRKQEGLII